jgi:hypothetical protein
MLKKWNHVKKIEVSCWPQYEGTCRKMNTEFLIIKYKGGPYKLVTMLLGYVCEGFSNLSSKGIELRRFSPSIGFFKGWEGGCYFSSLRLYVLAYLECQMALSPCNYHFIAWIGQMKLKIHCC